MTLEGEMRRVLLALEMTSCGMTANPDANGGGAFASKAPVSGGARISWNGRPSVDDDPPHVWYRRAWNAARSDERRLDLLEMAKDDLDAIRHTRAGQGGETEAERAARLLSEGEGFPARDVALKFNMSTTQVERTRKSAGRDKETGQINPFVALPDGASVDERRERVRLLRAASMPSRDIAEQLKVSQTLVMKDYRWLDAHGARSVVSVA